MDRLFPRLCTFIVLCHIIFSGIPLHAQATDSSKSIVFSPGNDSHESPHKRSGLEGIASVGIGNYSGFHDGGQFGSFIQPTLGFEFSADPGSTLRLLLGGRIGFLKAFTTGIMLGLRFPIEVPKQDIKIFSDAAVLFFDDAAFEKPLKYGLRLAFGARTLGSIDMEYRLAGEWRGTGSDSVDRDRLRTLWWVGAEVGIAFSLVGERKIFSRKDSLHASLHYIASGEEMEDLEAISSDAKMDRWEERFWRVRELSRSPKARDMRSEYDKRVEAANRLFSRSKVLGIQTDPGRVMAIYGLPETERKEYSSIDNRNQYMLWVYSGRVSGFSFATFLFRKTNNELDWIQVYSNVAGELSGPVPPDIPSSMTPYMGL